VRDPDGDGLMAGLEPGTARMTHPDPDVDDAVVQASQVPHFEYAGWRYVDGDREDWPAELQRFEGQTQVRLRHPETGGTATVGEDSAPHWRSRGWVIVDDVADQAAALEGKTVPELRELAKERGISPIPATKAELVEALEGHDVADDDQAGDEPEDEE
jgi:hypothetical protein